VKKRDVDRVAGGPLDRRVALGAVRFSDRRSTAPTASRRSGTGDAGLPTRMRRFRQPFEDASRRPQARRNLNSWVGELSIGEVAPAWLELAPSALVGAGSSRDLCACKCAIARSSKPTRRVSDTLAPATVAFDLVVADCAWIRILDTPEIGGPTGACGRQLGVRFGPSIPRSLRVQARHRAVIETDAASIRCPGAGNCRL